MLFKKLKNNYTFRNIECLMINNESLSINVVIFFFYRYLKFLLNLHGK